MNPWIRAVCAPVVLLSVTVLSSEEAKPTQNPDPAIREEHSIVVNGARETWRLQWKGEPKSRCGAGDDDALTCPCMGFAYGELGDLYLMRLREGIEFDQLRLTPLFREEAGAVIPRWPKDEKLDSVLSERKDFPTLVRKRPTVQVMQFDDDYDHDGRRTEFYLQTGTVPCGKSVGVVVGLSANNPRLHVFGTASNPSKPLYLPKQQWQALRDAASGAVSVVDWACGDHGAETQTEVQLGWSPRGIEGERREYTCPRGHETRRLIKQEPL